MLGAVDYYRTPLDERASLPEKTWGLSGDEVPSVALETDLATSWYSITRSSTRRSEAARGGRMFTINMQARQPDDDLEPVRKSVANLSRHEMERAYGDVMLQTASPERMRHLEQRLANDGHLAALSAKVAPNDSKPPATSAKFPGVGAGLRLARSRAPPTPTIPAPPPGRGAAEGGSVSALHPLPVIPSAARNLERSTSAREMRRPTETRTAREKPSNQ